MIIDAISIYRILVTARKMITLVAITPKPEQDTATQTMGSPRAPILPLLTPQPF